MPFYAYKAMDADGQVVAGRIEAMNPVDLELRLARMELDYIDGMPVKPGTGWRRGVPRRELINFFFHLEQLIRAGVPVVDALIDLRASVAAGNLRAVLADMVESIEGGKTLSQAMAQHPQVFDEIMSSLVRIGENSGRLLEVLAQLIAALKWQDELAAHARKLLLYPAFLATAMVALAFFMLVYLVPKLAGFMKGMGQTLPPHTEALLAVSGFLAAYWHLVLLVPTGVALVLAASVRTRPKARLRFDAFKLKVPWLGPILSRIVLARFAGAFAMMYASGITVLDAIRACERVAGNVAVARALERAGRMISAGDSVSAAFQDAGLFPPLVIRMLRVGENTGSLDTALANVSYFYGRDVHEAVARAQVLIEPALTVLIGIFMGWIMLSVFGPLYDVVAGVRT
jgi:type IV pilus assembly protein PilC